MLCYAVQATLNKEGLLLAAAGRVAAKWTLVLSLRRNLPVNLLPRAGPSPGAAYIQSLHSVNVQRPGPFA